MGDVTYLVLVKLIERLCLNLFDGIVLASWNVLSFVDLSVLLTRTEEINLLKVLLPKHLFVFDLSLSSPNLNSNFLYLNQLFVYFSVIWIL